MALFNAHGGPVVFASLCTFGTYAMQYAAEYVISEVTLSLTMLALPLLVPFTAVCFEREVNGEVKQYGLWPCLIPGTPNNPHWACCPAWCSS